LYTKDKSVIYKITQFQQVHPSFSSIPSTVFSSSLWVALKKRWFVGDETKMQIWRQTELLQMLQM